MGIGSFLIGYGMGKTSSSDHYRSIAPFTDEERAQLIAFGESVIYYFKVILTITIIGCVWCALPRGYQQLIIRNWSFIFLSLLLIFVVVFGDVMFGTVVTILAILLYAYSIKSN